MDILLFILVDYDCCTSCGDLTLIFHCSLLIPFYNTFGLTIVIIDFVVQYCFHSFTTASSKTPKANSSLQSVLEVCLAQCIAFTFMHSVGRRSTPTG